MSTGSQEKKRDWFKTIVHFFCGALLGALYGLGRPWGWSGEFGWAFLLRILVPSLVVGLLSAKYLDRFWDWIRDKYAH